MSLSFIRKSAVRFFHGMDTREQNAYICSLPYNFRYCVNGKGWWTEIDGEYVFVLKPGVLDLTNKKTWKLRNKILPEEVEDLKLEFAMAKKIFIPSGIQYNHPQRRKIKGDGEKNVKTYTDEMKKKFKNLRNHEVVLYIEKGENGSRDQWRLWDSMNYPGVKMAGNKRNEKWYNHVRRLLVNKYGLERGEFENKKVKVATDG